MEHTQHITRTVLTADVVNSTGLYAQFSNAQADAIVATTIAEIRAVVMALGGEVFRESGDEIACCFEQTGAAAQAAGAVHSALRELPLKTQGPERPPTTQVRIGLHRGSVPDPHCARMSETAKLSRWAAGNANPEQTLATLSVMEDLPQRFRSVSRFVDDETWDFVSLEHIELFEIVWDVDAVTASRGEVPLLAARGYAGIELGYRDHLLRLDDEVPVGSIGRGAHNAIVVPDPLVSRQHLSLQFSRGRCTIRDNSTNGTYLACRGQTPFVLRRDSYPLQGTGLIYLGNPAGGIEPIRYTCLPRAEQRGVNSHNAGASRG